MLLPAKSCRPPSGDDKAQTVSSAQPAEFGVLLPVCWRLRSEMHAGGRHKTFTPTHEVRLRKTLTELDQTPN